MAKWKLSTKRRASSAEQHRRCGGGVEVTQTLPEMRFCFLPDERDDSQQRARCGIHLDCALHGGVAPRSTVDPQGGPAAGTASWKGQPNARHRTRCAQANVDHGTSARKTPPVPDTSAGDIKRRLSKEPSSVLLAEEANKDFDEAHAKGTANVFHKLSTADEARRKRSFECYLCGSDKHFSRACPHIADKRTNCSQKGHVQRCCRGNKKLQEAWTAFKVGAGDVTIKTYTGEIVQPCGAFKAAVWYKDQARGLPFYVVDNGGPALLGRERLETFCFGLGRISAVYASCVTIRTVVQASGTTPRGLKALLDKYSTVLDDALGKIEAESSALRHGVSSSSWVPLISACLAEKGVFLSMFAGSSSASFDTRQAG
ncbi:hypothetical protein HPB50_000389 [Hyalomma asiaticum]|uniref:Uncharacterized protein n=1 Tax=Hyalomma asiaticum TaxID=266040 RepID=A0ACB7SCX9_HYAAI|nr:hypothetical protein HPB50_000389 [Hyalomma asiaticum]